MNKSVSIITGIILAFLSCGILILAFETNRSFLQIGIAFLLFILPISFISSIHRKVAVFIFTSFLIIGGYICIKMQWFDTGFGIALAILLGGATYLFRVSKSKTFDSADYKATQQKIRKEKIMRK